MVNYKMVKDLITKWGEINAHTTSQENQNKREEGRAGGDRKHGVLRNVGGITEGGGAKSNN